jgi:hypothetical protein
VSRFEEFSSWNTVALWLVASHARGVCLGAQEGKITKFSPFSKYPPCYKDVSFWVDKEKGFNNNDFFEIVRNIGGDLVEQVRARRSPSDWSRSRAYADDKDASAC